MDFLTPVLGRAWHVSATITRAVPPTGCNTHVNLRAATVLVVVELQRMIARWNGYGRAQAATTLIHPVVNEQHAVACKGAVGTPATIGGRITTADIFILIVVAA